MQAERPDLLQRIIDDPNSDSLERDEAQRELDQADAVTQKDEDNLLERYLDRQIEPDEYVRLEIIDLGHALVYGWLIAAPLDKLESYVDMLMALNARTQSVRIKMACREAIMEWMKLGQLYLKSPHRERLAANDVPFDVLSADRAVRRAARFLEAHD